MTSPTSTNPLAGHRIVVGPNEISGVASRIAMAVARAGAEVLFFNEQDHPFDPQIRETATLRRLYWSPIGVASRWRAQGGFAGAAGAVLTRLVKTMAFLKTCLWARTVVIIGGKGFFAGTAEYLLLRALGKRVVHVFTGTASRPRYLAGNARSVLRDGQIVPKELAKLVARTRRQASRVRSVSKHASVVIDNPLSGHFHEKPFVDLFKLGVPLDVAALVAHPRLTENTPPRQPGMIRILHSPTAPAIKGSAQIQAVIAKLVAEGFPIEFRQLTGVPRTQVLHEIAQCDLVVDQLFSDSPLAGFAAEASAFGKTAVVGGYGWKLFRDSMKPEELPPTATCHPDELETTLRDLLRDPARLQEIGERTRSFLIEHWSEAAFGARFARVVLGDIPEDWWFRPGDVRYLHGLGLKEGEAQRIVGGMVEAFGPGSLQVDHAPELRSALVAFGQGQAASY